jgi:prephenate dehydrogenase
MDAAQHDQIVAATSHLPFVVASNLVTTVGRWANGDGAQASGGITRDRQPEQKRERDAWAQQVWDLTASGFRDTTRLAASDTQMMLDILLTNSENVAELMRYYSRHFAELADLIYDEEEATLRERLMEAAARRRELGGV